MYEPTGSYTVVTVHVCSHGAPRSSQELIQKCPCILNLNLNLEMLVFEERGKPEYPEKKLSKRVEDQQQTQPTYEARPKNRAWDTLVGGECSHHCVIPAPQLLEPELIKPEFYSMLLYTELINDQ